MLRLLPKFACNWTKTGLITDQAQLEVAQHKLFQLVYNESFSLEKKSLQESSPINKTSTKMTLFPFIGTNGLLCAKGRTELLENVTFGTKRLVILDARN